ncbi:hypothetical protein LINPERHAP1_LOCUS43446 [Linum perenne]
MPARAEQTAEEKQFHGVYDVVLYLGDNRYPPRVQHLARRSSTPTSLSSSIPYRSQPLILLPTTDGSWSSSRRRISRFNLAVTESMTTTLL